MLKEQDSSTALNVFFKKNKLGKIADLFRLLKTKSRMSVFRRLRELHYLSSYTHSGKYYTLNTIPDFNSSGLWYFNEVGFSRFGNLKKTALHLIEQSASGRTHEELEQKLHVRAYNTLLDLIHSNEVTRLKVNGEYVYFSIVESQSKKQLSHRKNYSHQLKQIGLSDWIIIEILASIIRTSHETCIDPAMIVSDLISRDLVMTEDQVERVLIKFNLKKILDSP